jgi:uncharacterized protein (DUF2336 family)
MLNHDLLTEFAAAPGPSGRARVAKSVGDAFTEQRFAASEKQIAEDIFFLMVRDVAEVVREALAHAVKFASDLPVDIARSLALDAPMVALPFLAVSEVLSDADLISVIALRPEEYAVAIAKRARVSEPVSDALVATDNKSVVVALTQNSGAELSEPTLEHVLNKFGSESEITNHLAMRDNLPMRIAERLVTLVSEKIRHHLVKEHGVSADLAEDISLETAERGTTNLLYQTSDLPDIIGLVDQLYNCRKLTPTVLMRSLAAGDIDFTETAIAKLSHLPASSTHQLIWSAGKQGIERLFAHARIPNMFVEPVQIALSIAQEYKSTGKELALDIKLAWQNKLPASIMQQLEPLCG